MQAELTMKALKPWLLVLLIASWVAPAFCASAAGIDPLLQRAIGGTWRSAANRARDRYRHPVETLEFFGLRPDMTVIELDPGAGWYTEILAPVLHDHGHLIEATSPRSSKFEKKLRSDPAVYGGIKTVPFDPPGQ